MALKLYQFPHSPYCIPISLILKNCDIEFEEVLVDNWNRHLVIELTDGAYYQVPVIENEGDVIYESTADSTDVAHYVNQFSKIDLFPDRISGIHEVLIAHIENDLEGVGFKTVDAVYIDGIEDLVARTNVIRHKERSFGRGCVEDWKNNREHLLASFYQGIDAFKGTLKASPFLFGEEPVYADYALYGVLLNVHFIPKHIRWEGREWLKDWKERLEGQSLTS